MRTRNKIKSLSAIAKAILGEAPEPAARECHRSSGLLMLCCALVCVSVGQSVILCVRLWVLVLRYVQTSSMESSILSW